VLKSGRSLFSNLGACIAILESVSIMYRLLRQLVAFQKRFRLLELPLPEIRPEFDRNTSNAGMLQSGMPRLARCQRIPPVIDAPPSCSFATIRRPKTEKSRAKPSKVLRLIFSPVAFVFSF
jgi:hypothetical protein